MFTLILISFLIFVIYNAVAIVKFDIPNSLSDTFYLFGDSPKGYIFTLMMFAIGFTLLPCWLELSEGKWYQFLSFFACASCVGVGAAPAFKQQDSLWHTGFALCCAVCSLLWVFLFNWGLSLICLLFTIMVIYGWMDSELDEKAFKRCRTYRLELIAFIVTYAVLLGKTINKI